MFALTAPTRLGLRAIINKHTEVVNTAIRASLERWTIE
jgi:hypothetical protein